MPTHVLYGPRLGREGEVRIGCSALILDRKREKVLLTRRADNNLWCLPGGRIEAGESVAEACEREVLEETGLEVRVRRLTGVYSNPDQLVVYPDGAKVFMVVLNFEVEVLAGEAGLSDETTDFGFFTLQDMESLPMHDRHRDRVEDALSGEGPWIK